MTADFSEELSAVNIRDETESSAAASRRRNHKVRNSRNIRNETESSAVLEVTAKQRRRQRRAKTSLVLSVFFILGLLGSCASGSDRETLWVFAASSLTDAFTEIAEAFEQANPNIEVRTQFAGSSQLAAQIASGAPADVFASANEAVMETLLPGGELARTEFSQPATFARNELVIAVPTDNPKGISSLADLADNDLLLAICDRGVPCGTLAREAAESAGIDLRPDTEEANVRAVLAKLLLGEVDAGLIYKSDVVAVARGTARGNSVAGDGSASSNSSAESNNETLDTQSAAPVIAIPISPTHTNNYPIASVTGNPAATAFVEFVLSQEAQQILVNHGFAAIENPPAP